MTTRVVPVASRTAAGDTVMVGGRCAVVLHLLPRLAGRPPSARVTHEPPCRLCKTPLQWQSPAHGWRCSACQDTPNTRAPGGVGAGAGG